MIRAFLLSPALLMSIFLSAVQAQQFQALHSFGGSDGSNPNGNLQFDTAGNLYGTTTGGGQFGRGTIFRLSPAGQFSVVYSFTGGADGSNPEAGLVIDPSTGNLYGTTTEHGVLGYGGIFRLSAAGALTVLHDFKVKTDGDQPNATLTRDGSGNLFGTTYQEGPYGGGTLFELTANGVFKVLHAPHGAEGSEPIGRLLKSGSYLFGINTIGGSGSGTIFKATSSGGYTTLYTPNMGIGLSGGPVRDAAGTLYGPSLWNGNGYIYALSPAGALSTFHAFTGGADGRFPAGDLLLTTGGHLYGAAIRGGSGDNGTVFRLDLNGNFTALHVFTGQDGATPNGGLVLGKDGMLYGTTSHGGSHDRGAVYRVATR